MPENTKVRTPTETLFTCLEDFGKCEAKYAIVVYSNSEGDLCWSGSDPLPLSQAIGALECVKQVLLQSFVDNHDTE